MKSIMYIGIGDLEACYVDMAKGFGFNVIVANKHPRAKSLENADVPLAVDGKNIDRLLEFVLLYNDKYNIQGIYTGTELHTTTAALTNAIGIRGISLAAAFAGDHKSVAKKVWMDKGISTPRFRIQRWHSADVIGNLPLEYEDAMVCKPSDGICSKGTSVVEHYKDFQSSYQGALDVSQTKTVLVEEFIDGALHDVNGIFAGGVFRGLGICDKLCPDKECVVAGATCPTEVSTKVERKLYELMEQAARAVGCDYGPVCGDFIVKDGEPYIMEWAPRFHGPMGSLYLVPGGLGIHHMDVWLTYLSDGDWLIKTRPTRYMRTTTKAIKPEGAKSNYDLWGYQVFTDDKMDVIEVRTN